MRKMTRWACMLLALLVAGCIADPSQPPPVVPTAGTNGVLVVNEGIWRQDNSTLTYYDPVDGRVVQDYFTAINPGLRLGDLGNSVVAWNGRAYIAVSTSRTIEVMELASGRSLGRVRLANGNEPRMIAIVDSARGYVTTRSDSVIPFNPMTFTTGPGIAVGPAPEGIAYGAGRLFVANSGLGGLRRGEPGAGTVSVIDPATGARTGSVAIAPNPRVLHVSSVTGRLYALYGLYDSTGGLVELDPATLVERRRWMMHNAWDAAFDDASGSAYVIGGAGVLVIDLNAPAGEPRTLLDSNDWKGTLFYSIAVSPARGDIYLGITRGFTTEPGEAVIIGHDGALKGRFATGIYPGDFAFY
jgi:DNA-binding beta-propeller fold protein YncE